ncbi:gluconate:H+ symporter [Flavihumibacter stibioxidans]|uniref:Gluconate transporter n=1 Tax=Flavihumibacter stibioxidans TaxID=1834163 RepID=A0ABR7MBL6_9BACT|nr:gluconate:H+ symporter [Flavihumibacter stibioxidans]MBC6492405.1 gluconate transporter [Flavihumibacter stibioxidans]
MRKGFSIHPFIGFLLVSVLLGLCFGLPPMGIVSAVEKGVGDIMSGLLILLVLGAMFGKIIAETGAAQRIAALMLKMAGPKYIQWAMALIGFVIGIPLFYGVGFVLLVPLAFSVSYSSKLSPVFVGLPMLAALSVTHGFLPPHPSPSALVVQFGASMGHTLIYGIIVAIPAIIVAGPILSRFLKQMRSEPLEAFLAPEKKEQDLPGSFVSIFTALLPIALLVITTLVPAISPGDTSLNSILAFIGSPSVVLLIALVAAAVLLGMLNRISMSQITAWCGSATKDIAPVLLIVAGSGALKQVLTVSGTSDMLANSLQGLPLHPLVLGWLMAAIIRATIGSATVAGLTTAGIMMAFLQQTGTDPNLMVLSIGAGSLAFSHVNDSGFWLYKEYFNLSIKETLLSWSVMETLVAIVGLVGVLLLNFILH